ncbi:hypothetical protein [Planococcus donghaensis]|uniref:hypothetical protein n=1 Tax=Planococcus donghaensis TaxID=414778 RepID=UPI00373578B9
MPTNAKGASLVEVLAVLLLVSIIGGIGWTALNIGIKHNSVETTKTQLQQEANLIVTKLVNEHRRSDHYYLRLSDGQLEINSCDTDDMAGESCDGFMKLTQQSYRHKGSVNGINFTALDSTRRFEPKKSHVRLVLEVTDQDEKLSAGVETKLTRILTDR